MQNFAFKFQAIAEKTANNVRGLLYFAAPCISAVYKLNSNGPSTEFCGTPYNNCCSLDRVPLYVTCCVLSVRNYVNHWRTRPDYPKFPSSRCSSIEWSTQSNSAHISKRPSNGLKSPVPISYNLVTVQLRT